jgi:hypothetical protein
MVMNITSHLVQYDDKYETCLETRAALMIYSGSIDPNIITQRFGFEPTQKSVKGDSFVNKFGKTIIYKHNYWNLSSEGKVASLDLRHHLDWLLEKLNNISQHIFNLQKTKGVEMTIRCFWLSRNGQGGPTIWPEQMKAMADLNLECSFEINFFGETE